MDDLDENMQFLGVVSRFDYYGANAWDDCGIATIQGVPEPVAALIFEGLCLRIPLKSSVGGENVPSEVRSYESVADM